MEGHVFTGELAAGIFCLIVGARLARLASRTRETPERLLAALFIANGLSYVLYTIPDIFNLESLWTPLNFAGRVTYLPAPVLMAVFTRQVFRREAPWAAWLVYGTAALLVAGVAGSALGGDWEGFTIGNRWFWLEWVGYTVPFGWAGAEALVQYHQARRRLSLGLSDSLICNRLLLWSLFATTQLCVALAILPQYASYEQQNLFSATWDTLIGALEIFSVAAIWLVFFPPAAYRRWIAGGEAVTGAVEGS
jgi:hypothetical protein